MTNFDNKDDDFKIEKSETYAFSVEVLGRDSLPDYHVTMDSEYGFKVGGN